MDKETREILELIDIYSKETKNLIESLVIEKKEIERMLINARENYDKDVKEAYEKGYNFALNENVLGNDTSNDGGPKLVYKN